MTDDKKKKGVRCSECPRRDAELVTGLEIYPHRRDLASKNFYRCPCGAYVGCHPGTDQPLGSCAGPETRRARSAVHAEFDPLWRSKAMRRSEAYKALAAEMGIDPKRCHISWMDAREAKLALLSAKTLRSKVPA